MMIHEYHKIAGKTKTIQELRLKNKKWSRFEYFYLAVDSLKVTFYVLITIFLFSLTLQSQLHVVQLEILEVS